jgi:phosphatidyl-myo-inositol dimannoside synthase
VLKRRSLRMTQRVWTRSEYTKARMIAAHGVNPADIAVIPTPLDTGYVQGMRDLAEVPEETYRSRVLSVSRLSSADAYKGIDHTIQAVASIREDIPDVTYVIVGDGDDKDRLEGLALESGVEDIVRFAGRASDPELHAYYQGTDVFALPSKNEGLGLVYIEAMAYGKPSIAGRHGGAPEVVLDGRVGLLVEHGDVDALGEALKNLLTDDVLRRRLGEQARQRACEVYGYRQFATAIRREIEHLVSL